MPAHSGSPQASAIARSQLDPETPEVLLQPSDPDAQELYRLAYELQQIAPWDFMFEREVFGVEDPETGVTSFVSVMGSLGEYRCVAAYTGSEGLYGLLEFDRALQINPESKRPFDLVMETPKLELLFAKPEIMESHDTNLMRSVDLKFEGAQPQFRSYRPGFHPYFITRTEARQIRHILSQTIAFASDYQANRELLPQLESLTYLVRVPQKSKNGIEWTHEIRSVDGPSSQLIPFPLDEDLVSKLKQGPRRGVAEVDFFRLPGRIRDADERPHTIYSLLAVDEESGFILGFEVMAAEHGVDMMYANIPDSLAAIFAKAGTLPERLLIQSSRLMELLEPLSEQLELPLSLVQNLRGMDRAQAFLLAKMLKQR